MTHRPTVRPTPPGATPAAAALALALALLAGACEAHGPRPSVGPIDPPMVGVLNAYESAARVQLPQVPPEDRADLHNVFHLSETIISGGEPHSEEAFARIAAWGVKTIVSVDGKVPDAQAAARHGLRYVHIPIQYKGIREEELLRLAKTFREREAPFYVHCFHGRHRGPAAAAVGRLVLDGAGRAQALAEMRQWCGTSSKYEGLYRTLATASMPDVENTARYGWDFPAAYRTEGFRGSMVGISRAYDHLDALVDRNWEADPDHPDVVALNEATQLAELFDQGAGLDEVLARPEDFQGWLSDARQAAGELRDALGELTAGDSGAGERAAGALERVAESCSACHKAYRNH